MKSQLALLAQGSVLSAEDTTEVFECLLDSEADISDAQIGAYLFATALRVPSAQELLAAAQVLRRHMLHFDVDAPARPLLDTCGTGGSGLSTFNTSTAVSFVCAAAGQGVAKHGNRAASSKSGSADVLEALGLELSMTPERQSKQLSECGFTFLFAPHHHAATKRVALLRKSLGLRTIFNFLGPLLNPAKTEFQLLGVSSLEAMEPMAQALEALGVRAAMVVRGRDGLDELSCGAQNDVYEISSDGLRHYTIQAEDFGLEAHDVSSVRVDSPQESADAIRSVLEGKPSAFREYVVLNAGAALYVSQKAESIDAGVELAAEILDSGKGFAVLEKLQAFSR